MSSDIARARDNLRAPWWKFWVTDYTRDNAIKVLGETRDPSNVPFMVEELDRRLSRVTKECAMANNWLPVLFRANEQATADLARVAFTLREHFEQELPEAGKAAQARNCLEAAKPIQEALVGMGPAIVPALQEELGRLRGGARSRNQNLNVIILLMAGPAVDRSLQMVIDTIQQTAESQTSLPPCADCGREISAAMAASQHKPDED